MNPKAIWSRIRRITKAVVAGVTAGGAALAGTAAGACVTGTIASCTADALTGLTIAQVVVAVGAAVTAFGLTYQVRNVEPVAEPKAAA